MARLRDTTPRNVSGGYKRIFGNAKLGLLASKIHSASVSSGTELERMIADAVHNIPALDTFLRNQAEQEEGVLLARKTQIKNSAALDLDGGEPDFMVFRRRNGVQTCHLVELKDGHVFDTKKVRAEWNAINGFIQRNACHIACRIRLHFCAFNQDDRRAIVHGFKGRIPLESVLTGREFCELLRIAPVRRRIMELLGQTDV